MVSGETATITIVLNVLATTAGGWTISNGVIVVSDAVDPDPSNNKASTDTLVGAAPGVRLAVADSADPILVNRNLVYTVTLVNNGPTAVTKLVLTQALPSATTYRSTTPGSDWACQSPAAGSNGGTVTCTKETMAAGEQSTFTNTVTVGVTAGTISSTATVTSSSGDITPADNTETESTSVVTGDPVNRLAGADRIQTAIEASKNSYANGKALAVVLARNDDFADALAGTALADAKTAPLLLTTRSSLDTRTQAEIQRVAPLGSVVYLLGGFTALSAQLQNQVVAMGYKVIRFPGADRFDTAVRIAQSGLDGRTTILLATGRAFPDGLCGGAAAARVGGAVLLTDGSAMPSATQAYLANHTGGTIYAVGGPAASANPTAIAVVGVDRYDTCRKIAEKFFSQPQTVGVASGADFPDALSGGAHAAHALAPLLLAQKTTLPTAPRVYMDTNRVSITQATVFGGTGALADAVKSAVQDAIT
jgi:uncharacterized repeat protein (TIGR01451 family)